jgi:hypothetical protein
MAERVVPVFLPVLTAVVGGVWAVWLFTSAHRDAALAAANQASDTAQTRLIEAQKPFLDKQLELYVRASKTVGTLIIIADGNKDGAFQKWAPEDASQWADAKRGFLSLFWAELPMVENTDVETAMVNVRDALKAYENFNHLNSQLQKRAYCLGHAIRKSIEEGWRVRVGTGPIPQKVFEGTIPPAPSGAPAGSADSECTSPIRWK